MARKQHHNTISLFPFLAVLVCAMGSLILLLLVMTRKMRQDQLIEHATAVASVAAEPDHSSEIADLEAKIKSAQDNVLAMQSSAVALGASVAENQATIVSLQEELKSLQSKPEESGDETQTTVTRSLTESRQLKAKEAALLRQLKDSEKQLFDKQQQLVQADEASKDASLVLQKKHSDLISLRAQVEEATKQLKTISGTSTLLEFSNSTGTTRTPIVIDVSASGFELLPNGIRISAAEMEGFPIRDNPLLSAILTTHRLRSGNSVTAEPYVLLLVRPDGSLAFYGAQKILTDSHIHFGYELLESDHRVVAGEPDPTETPAIQASIREALTRRENLYAKLMAIAQQKSGLQESGGPGKSPAERRLTVRPDGRVLMNEGVESRPLDGRFYAGGVAPPRSHFQNRPAGGYSGLNPDRMTAEDAEKLADEFAERYARRQASPTAATEEPPQESLAETVNGSSADVLRSPGERRFAESLFGRDGRMQTAKSREVTRESDWPVSSVLASDSKSQSSASEVPGTTEKSKTGRHPDSLLFAGEEGGKPSTGIPDLSKIDPDLLRRLGSGKSQSSSQATPIGITVFLDEHHMTVAQQPSVEVTPETLDAVFAVLLTGINTEVDDTKRNPHEPIMPIVKFIVSPGGEKWRIPLAHSLKRTGIRSATVYELTPYMTKSDETGRARLENNEQL